MHNDLVCGYLLCVFDTHAGSSGRCSGAGRVLSRLHDSGRVQCPGSPHQRRWKHRTWLGSAACSYHR